MCRIGTPPSNAAFASDKKPRRSGVLCRNRMRSGRNGLVLLDASFGGGRPRGHRLVLPLHIVGQLFPARFLGFARSPEHLVELIAHEALLSYQATGESPLSRLELSIHATPRAAEVQREEFPSRPNRQPVLPLPRNQSFRRAMKTNPIGALRVAALLAAALFSGAAPAQPQAYPSRIIRLVAGTAPGGITDYLARMSAEGLAGQLGQQVVVENKPGATGNLAIEYLAKSPPDGYTLLLVAGGNVVITPFLYGALPFDPLNDIVPVFNVAGAPQLLVVPGAL